MSAVVGIILAVVAIFVLIKVTFWILKALAVIVLIGVLIGGYMVLRNRIGRG